MKNKTIAIFGIGTYILSVLASAEDLEGNSTAPIALILISAIATSFFIIMAVIRLWKTQKIVSILLIASTGIMFISSIFQIIALPLYGSPLIILINATKVIYLVAFIWSIINLFRNK